MLQLGAWSFLHCPRFRFPSHQSGPKVCFPPTGKAILTQRVLPHITEALESSWLCLCVDTAEAPPWPPPCWSPGFSSHLDQTFIRTEPLVSDPMFTPSHCPSYDICRLRKTSLSLGELVTCRPPNSRPLNVTVFPAISASLGDNPLR